MNEKYFYEFQQLRGDDYRLGLHFDFAGTAAAIEYGTPDPVRLKTLSASRDHDTVVQGSELVFDMVFTSDPDEFLELDYKDVKVILTNDTTSKIEFVGWLQTENITKELFRRKGVIQLSATDALMDLSDEPFEPIGRATGMEIIKAALEPLGLEHDFLVKLGTVPVEGGVNGLISCTFDSRHLEGTCLEAIEKILRPFFCVLRKVGDYYVIKNLHEDETEDRYEIDWATLTVQMPVDPAGDKVVINDNKFRPMGEASTLSPIKYFDLTLFNANLGEAIVPDINDYVGGPWNFAGFIPAPSVETDVFGRSVLKLEVDQDNEATRTILLPAFNVDKREGEENYLSFAFQAKVDNPDNINPVRAEITVTRPDASTQVIMPLIGTGWTTIQSPTSEQFEIVESGNYSIAIKILASELIPDDYSADILLKDFSLTQGALVNDVLASEVSTDTLYKSVFEDGKLSHELDVWFGDTEVATDLASINRNGNATSTWNRVGKADGEPLLQLLARHIINSRSKYVRYMVFETVDADIGLFDFLELNGDHYDIVSYDKSFRTGRIRLHVRERVVTDAAFTFDGIPLDTVDGQTDPYVPPRRLVIPSEDVETAEVEETETAEVEEVETDDTELADVEETETAEVEEVETDDTELADVEETETAEVDEADTADVEQPDLADVEPPGVVGVEEVETDEVETDDTELADVEETETAEVEEPELADVEPTDLADVDEISIADVEPPGVVGVDEVETITKDQFSRDIRDDITDDDVPYIRSSRWYWGERFGGAWVREAPNNFKASNNNHLDTSSIVAHQHVLIPTALPVLIEIQIGSSPQDNGYNSVGLTDSDYDEEHGSVENPGAGAYMYADTGSIWADGDEHESGIAWTSGDKIGMRVFENNYLQFTKNGDSVGLAMQLPNGRLFPTFRKAGDEFAVTDIEILASTPLSVGSLGTVGASIAALRGLLNKVGDYNQIKSALASIETRVITLESGEPTTYTLTLNKEPNITGIVVAGAGTYASNVTVFISTYIELPDSELEFDGWTVTSGAVVLDDANSPNTFFTMPLSNVVLQANYS